MTGLRRFKYTLLIVVAMLCALPRVVYAQRPTADKPSEFFGAGSEAAAQEEADSTKKKKERVKRPLESYHFDDTTRSTRIIVWTIDRYTNHVKNIGIDTMQTGFQIQYPNLREEVGDAWLGNIGAAAYPLSYFRRVNSSKHSFSRVYDAYNFDIDDVRFFNVKKPHTRLEYIMAGQTAKLEEDFAVTHAQNVTPELGFNVDYRTRGTRGVYMWQNTRDKHLSLAANYTGKKYTVHAGYVYNNYVIRENGGLVDDRMVKDSLHNYELSTTIPMKLSDARNRIKNNSFFLTQSYGLPFKRITDNDFTIGKAPVLFIGHEFEYNRWWRKSTDTYAGCEYNNILDSLPNKKYNFYENWYLNSTESRDSTFESSLENRVFIQFQPWDRDGVIGVIDAGVGVDVEKFYQFRLDQYLTGNRAADTRTSYYAYGGIKGNVRKYFDWQADARIHPFGYRAGELSIGGRATASLYAKGKPISLGGYFRYEHRMPNYWEQSFYSNHFMWNNSFGFTDETRFGVTFDLPIAGFSAGFDQSVVTGHIYYGTDFKPHQHSDAVSVSSLYLREDLAIKGFHLNHRVQAQFSSAQEVIPVPLVAAYLSYYYEFNVVKNVLKLQVGIDGRYNTKYYAKGYNPATGQFYNQRDTEVGNYVYLDAFITAKWKRMRILLKLQHFNKNLWGRREYFTVAHYPLNPRIFKLGISWTFYD